MSDIDRLEIKIKADATEAERALKKLNQQIGLLGQGKDATKQVRAIKNIVETIKVPTIRVDGIKEFAKQSRLARDNTSAIEKSANAINKAMNGVNFNKATRAKKTTPATTDPESERNWDEIPMFDSGTPMNEAAAAIKEQEDAIKAEVSETKELSSAFTETAKSIESAVDQTREFLRNLNQITSGMTGIDRVDNGEMAQDLERARQAVSGLKEEYEKSGRTWSRFSFPKISKETKNLNKMERQLKALIDEYIKLRIEGKDTPIRVKPVLKEIDRLQKEIGKTAQETVKLATAAKASVRKLKGESLADNTKKEKRKSRTRSGGSRKKSSGFSTFNMIGMSVLYSGVFQAISGIERAIAEGVHSMAQYSTNVNAYLSGMMSSLTMLRNAFAAAFEPIMSVVVPYLSTFISWLARAMNMVGQFFAALTGKGYAIQAKKVTQDYAASLGGVSDSAKGAADAIKNMYSLGFDELHTIDTSDTGGGGGAGGGAGELLPEDMFETMEIDSGIKGLADRVREAFETGDFYSLGAELSEKLKNALDGINWDSIYAKADKFGTGLASFLNGLIQPDTFASISETIAKTLNTALHFLDSFGTEFEWTNFGNSIAAGINGFFATFDFKLAAETANKWIKGILDSLITAVKNTNWFLIGQQIGDFIAGIDFISILSKVGELIWEAIKAAVELWTGLFDTAPVETAIVTALGLMKFAGLGSKVAENLITAIGPKLAMVGTTLSGFITGPWGIAIGAAIIGVFLIATHWDEIKKFMSETANALKDYYVKAWEELKTSTAELWNGIKETISEKWQAVKDFFTRTWDEMTSYYPQKIEELKTSWEELKTSVSEKFDAIKKKASEIIDEIAKYFPEKIEELKTGFENLKKDVIAIFKALPQGIYDTVTKFGEKFKSIGKWMWQGIKDGLMSLVPSGIKDAVSGILSSTQKEAEIHSPSKLFKREVGVYLGEGIIEGLKESVSGVGDIISDITNSVSGGTGMDATVTVEAPDITQWNTTLDAMAEHFQIVREGITTSMMEFYDTMQSLLLQFSASAQTHIQDFFPRLYQYIYNVFDAIRQTLQEVSNEVIKMLNNLVREANKLASLTGGKHYSYASNYIMKKASMFDIGKFAEGGFPRAGELFIANEAGPEMVGRIGNRTAVGSSDQIENAIYMAVLTAMSQVMAQSSSQPIELNQKIELDGDVIYNNQQRIASRRGIDFGLGAFQR